LIFCTAWLIFLGLLSGLHIYLLSRNITTNEQMKGLWKNRENYYDVGVVRNISQVVQNRWAPINP